MPEIEVKKLIEDQIKAFEKFKRANDERLDDIEKKGVADPLLAEKVDKANEDVAALAKQLDEIYQKMQMPGTPGDNPDVAAYAKAFGDFIRKGIETDLADLQTKALQTGVDADGGYAIPEELDRNILQLLKDESPMRQVCSVVQMGGAKYKKLVSIGNAASGWVGETDARPETGTPQLAEITPYMGEIYANPAATQQMLDDAFFNAETWLSQEVAREFATQEGTAFLTGDGTNKPKGILDYPSTTAADDTRPFGTLQHIVTAAAADIAVDELIDLVYSLKKGYRKGAAFMINTKTLALVRKKKDSNGQYLWQPSVQAGQPQSLLGYQVVDNEDMADATTGNVAVMFGSFSRAYLIVDRMGTRVLRDPYTHKPYVHFYTTKRVGGMLMDSQAIKLLQQA